MTAALAAAAVLLQVVVALPANAYHLIGCRMYSAVGISYYNGGGGMRDFEAIFNQAAADWTATSTPVSFTRVQEQARVYIIVQNRGADQADGLAYYPPGQTCSGQTYWSAQVNISMNNYYINNYASSRVKGVTGHELGHALGLDHQDTTLGCNYVPMMTSTTARRDSCGANSPRADDVAGVNAIY